MQAISYGQQRCETWKITSRDSRKTDVSLSVSANDVFLIVSLQVNDLISHLFRLCDVTLSYSLILCLSGVKTFLIR